MTKLVHTKTGKEFNNLLEFLDWEVQTQSECNHGMVKPSVIVGKRFYCRGVRCTICNKVLSSEYIKQE